MEETLIGGTMHVTIFYMLLGRDLRRLKRRRGFEYSGEGVQISGRSALFLNFRTLFRIKLL